MKLSDVKGERTFEVIADIIEPVARIAEDKEARELFARKDVPEGMEATQFFLGRVRKHLPKLLKGHRKDLVTILATIEGVPVKEYEADLNLARLVGDLLDLVNDEEFVGFLS
jgi:hypothetical protein